jgi:hypothetical protein
MFSRGRLGLRPHTVKEKAEINRIFAGRGKEYER